MRRLITRCAAALGSATVLAISASGAPTETKVVPANHAAGVQFGETVALDGDTAVVASPVDDQGAADAGAVHVFTRSGAAWTQQQKLIASDAAASDAFGRAADVDADTVVVGAPNDDDVGGNSGSAYVFVRAAGVWSQQQKLTASDAASGDEFGTSVAVDADTVAVGVPHANTPSTETGAAYVFVRSGSTWTEQQKLVPADAEFNDGFGRSVAVLGDTLLVGASEVDDGAGFHSGAAYVYVRSGSIWTLQQKIVPADLVAEDRFGWSVALSGETAVIGAPYLGVPSATNHGSAYVFVRSGSAWTQEARLRAADATISTPLFGECVSVSGETLVAGCNLDDEHAVDSGAAYVFARSGSSWTQQRKLTASDAATLDYLGSSVAISGDTVLAGAYGDDDGGSVAGAAYVFEGLAGGSGGRSVTYDAFLLPKKVVVKTNAKAPPKSKVTVSGFYDEGAVEPCWTEPVTLEVGTKTFAIAGMTAKGKSFEHSEPGLLFRVTPGKAGTSRGAFLIVRTADLTNEVNGEGALQLRFAGTGIDAKGTVTLAKGKYTLGKVRGKLVIPCVFPQSVALTLKGAGKDSLSLVMGFETTGYDVTIIPCIKIGIGNTFTAEILKADFTVKGQTFVFKGNRSGITDVKIDLAKELITVKGKAMTLTGLPAGSGPVRISVALDTVARGVDERSVDVEMIKSGATLKY